MIATCLTWDWEDQFWHGCGCDRSGGGGFAGLTDRLLCCRSVRRGQLMDNAPRSQIQPVDWADAEPHSTFKTYLVSVTELCWYIIHTFCWFWSCSRRAQVFSLLSLGLQPLKPFTLRHLVYGKGGCLKNAEWKRRRGSYLASAGLTAGQFSELLC